MRHVVDVVVVLFLLGTATMGVCRPDIIAQWVKQAHPSIDGNDRTLLWFIRFICAVGLGISLVLSMVIIRSFGI